MGKYQKTGLAYGTNGSPQMALANYEYDSKIRELEKRYVQWERDIQKLKEVGVKFTPQDVIFTTNDESGQLIWLEKGNENAGLKHIIKNHAKDFENKLGVSESEISNIIMDIITNGKLMSVSKRSGKTFDQYEKIYKYKNEYFFLAALGTNGYVVSMHPENNEDALWKIRSYQNEEKKH